MNPNKKMMTLARAIIVVLAIFAFPILSAHGGEPDRPPVFQRAPERVPNQYIVTLRDDRVQPGNVPGIAEEMRTAVHGRIIATFQHGLRGFAIEAPEQAIKGLLRDPRVSAIEENAIGHASFESETYPDNDDTWWNLDRIDQKTMVTATGKSYGWTTTGAPVDVYVVDTGIYSLHPEFWPGQVTSGVDFGGDGYPPTNPCGILNTMNGSHGTAVASVIGGQTVGVARDVRLIPVKVFACGQQYAPFYIQLNLIGGVWAMDWILAQAQTSGRRSVVNMSFYYETDETCVDGNGVTYNCAGALDYNIMKLLQANVVVVASANNQSQNRCVDTPTRYAQTPARAGYGGIYDVPSDLTKRLVITVGGTNIIDERYTCPYSTCGSNDAGSNFGPCVDIYAPADRVQVAHFASPWYRDRTNQAVASGTSFAAPIVSGIAARLLQKYPTKNVREIWDLIRNTASTLPVNFDADGNAANDRLAFISKFN
ncbi:MAG: S8 family serine peptidase [Thermoanaerobaculia bacterium]|nr:S8 family serine peptidase [Thermoanaerobaculia bacterium]